jgi:hypothetical protein
LNPHVRQACLTKKLQIPDFALTFQIMYEDTFSASLLPQTAGDTAGDNGAFFGGGSTA